MFEEVCSIYSDALDNVGRYVDMETGEIIQQMTIREFCLTDRWKSYVERLRELVAKYGSKAKKMQEYVDTKKQLPGATLSGLFATWDDECTTKDGRKFMAPVSRRETHLQQHTGWLAIDIDLGDNQNLSNFENIRMICRFRPEIALLMRSCSGTGYFGLVRLAYPERHKEQFKALLKEYAAIGIKLDKQCGNIGRVRFASWDEPEHIYIHKECKPYMGIEQTQTFPQPLPYRTGSEYYNGNYASPYKGEDGRGSLPYPTARHPTRPTQELPHGRRATHTHGKHSHRAREKHPLDSVCIRYPRSNRLHHPVLRRTRSSRVLPATAGWGIQIDPPPQSPPVR